MNQLIFFSLSKITNRVDCILQPHIGKHFWLKAEISSGRKRGGSFFCDLVETNKRGDIIAQMRCTIWASNLSKIKAKFKKNDINLKLDDGTFIGLQCCLQYSPKFGLSLKAFDADPAFTLGDLELKKKEILEKLKKEELLQPNKEITVPFLPIRIGLITSKNSSVYNDLISTLKSSRFGFEIFFADSIMQGDYTESSILRSLKVLENVQLELVVLIRGGGSKIDLFSMNNENIARKIAGYKYPVWTGIGHDTDFSVLDYVANKHFKTPTAVAEEIVSRFVEMKRYLQESKQRFKSIWPYRFNMDKKFISKVKIDIQQSTHKLFDHTRLNLKTKTNNISTKIFEKITYNKAYLTVSKKTIQLFFSNYSRKQKEKLRDKTLLFFSNCNRKIFYLKNIISKIHERFYLKRFSYRINNEKEFLNNKLAIIRNVDPKLSFKRGFVLIYNNKGKLIKTLKSISEGEIIKIKLNDGFVNSTVLKTKAKRK